MVGCQLPIGFVIAPNHVTSPFSSRRQLDHGRTTHGGLVDHRTWDKHREIVASDYRAIAMDLRYFGTDNWPDNVENFSVQVHANDLAALITSLGEEPVT